MDQTTAPHARQMDAVSALVERGIVMLQELDRDLVATYLLRRRVRVAVIARVLCEPHRRRK